MVGECTGEKWRKKLLASGFGRMWIARGRNIYTYDGEVWGFDNGAYRDWGSGEPFNESLYMSCLEKVLAHPHSPYLAVLPDVPGEGERSKDFSLEWLDRLGNLLPWYVAVQDGMTESDLDAFDGITGVFLGGTSQFKATARHWATAARRRGLRFHYGRCGTPAKLYHALSVGADSADSALVMWNKARWTQTLEIIRNGPIQQELFKSWEQHSQLSA